MDSGGVELAVKVVSICLGHSQLIRPVVKFDEHMKGLSSRGGVSTIGEKHTSNAQLWTQIGNSANAMLW